MTAFHQFRPAMVILALFALITGVAYPLAVTGIARVFFPAQAAGSVLVVDGRSVGSTLIGQPFTDPGTFWGRPSATQPFPYNAAASGGSNLAPTSATLLAQVQARVEALRAADPANTAPVPVDLVTASASGLDPHISPAAAEYQVARVARARGLDEDEVRSLVAAHTQGRLWGVLGEPRVNVLELNLALKSGYFEKPSFLDCTSVGRQAIRNSVSLSPITVDARQPQASSAAQSGYAGPSE